MKGPWRNGLAVLLLAVAGAADEPVERIDVGWRWRTLPLPEGLTAPQGVTRGTEGGLVVAFLERIAFYDGKRWRVSGAGAFDGHQVRKWVQVGRASLVLTDHGLYRVEPDGAATRLGPGPADQVGQLAGTLEGTALWSRGDGVLYEIDEAEMARLCDTPTRQIYGVGRDARGDLWCSVPGTLYRRTGGRWVAMPLKKTSRTPRRVLPARDGTVWFVGQSPVLHFWTGTELVERPLPPRVRSVSAAAAGRTDFVFASNDSSLFVPRGDRWIRLDRVDPRRSPVRSLSVTHDDRIVALTSSGELRLCDRSSRRWESIQPRGAGLGSIVNAVAAARKGGVWIGTDVGVGRWDGERFVESFTEAAGAPIVTVTTVHEDRRGHLWVGSGAAMAGALRWDGARWHRHREPDGVGDWRVHAIHPGRGDDLWFCLLDQGVSYDDAGGLVLLREGRWRRYTVADGLPHNRCYAVSAGPGGPPLVATLGGVAVLKGDRWMPFGGPAGPPGYAPRAILRDRAGDIWAGFGRRHGWLGRIDGDVWRRVEDHTWAGADALAILETAHGLWFTSERGLFLRRHGLFHEVTREPGAPRSFWPLAPDGSGGLYLGTPRDGLVRFRPDDREPPRTTHVHTYRANDGRVLAWRGSDTWEMTPPHLLRFRWRRAGGTWSAPVRGGELRLDLPPGTHELALQAIDLHGNLEEPVFTYAVRIPQPFWARADVRAGLGIAALCVFLVSLAIGRRRRRERIVRGELERFRAIMDQAGEAILVVDPEDARILDVNESAARELGYRRTELLRLQLPDIEVGARIETWEAFVADVRARGNVKISGEHRRRDGTVYPVDVSVAARSFTDREFLLVIASDVTLSRAAAETEERLRFIVEHTSELIYLQRVPDGKLLFVSPSCEKLTGYAPNEFAAFAPQLVVRDHPASRDLDVARKAGRGELDTIPPYTIAIRHRNGEIRIQQVHENYVTFKGERMLLGIAVDATEIYEARGAMIHAEKLKSLGILAGGVAHDFNNLLVGVLGNAQLARAQAVPGGDTERHLDAIETAATRASELCRQLLSYAGKGQRSVAAIDLSELVDEMVRLVQVSVPRRVAVELVLARDLPPVSADPAQLRQVVLNLVTNAAEAIGDTAGRIRIATRAAEIDAGLARRCVGRPVEPGRYICLEVADNGCGMDAETRARMFDPFFTTKFTGRGLGLAAVQGIVQAHQGGLVVETKRGKGSTFRLLLRPSDSADASADSAGAAERVA